MDPEGELETLNIKLAEEEAAIQHGLNPLLKEVSVVEDGKKPAPKVDEEKVEEKNAQPGKKKKKLKANEDIFNIILLLILYILQGIPSGLTFSVPLILSTRNVSYSDQGTFSFALWPFSIRLLWAPIVDSLSIARIGRRKTWVVGCFITVGLIMVSFAQYVHNILQADREKNSTDIYILTLIFGTLVFLIATQDIALDAWSLDLLMHKNVGWQSICNSVGIGMGGFMGGALFLTLESVKFSNQFIRPLFKLEPQNYGVFTIKQFCYTFGIVSIVTGLSILFFKSEHSKRKLKKSLSAEEGDTTNALPSKRSILINYKLVWSLLKLSAIRKLIFIFLTVRIGFASEHVVRLKLVELGVEREKISILSVLIAPILTVLPFVVKKYINGPKPLDLFRSAYIYKMLMLIIVIMFTYYVPYFKDDVTGAFTYTFYILFFVISLVSSMISFVSWVSVGGFCAKISDKTIGGTYLTFLGFWLSLGSNWSKTACLYLISWLTFKQCVYIGPHSSILANNATSSIVSSNNQNVTLETAAISNNKCSSNLDQKKCTQSGGYCITTFDGFYIISLSLLFIALLWLILTRRMIDYLQILPKSAWCVSLPTEQSTPTPTSLDDDENDNDEAKKTNKK